MDLLESEPDLLPIAAWASTRGMEIAKASARTGDGVYKMFARLAAKIQSQGLEQRKLRADDILKDICQADVPSEGSGNTECC
jgi:hypothetical protein